MKKVTFTVDELKVLMKVQEVLILCETIDRFIDNNKESLGNKLPELELKDYELDRIIEMVQYYKDSETAPEKIPPLSALLKKLEAVKEEVADTDQEEPDADQPEPNAGDHKQSFGSVYMFE